MPLKSKLKNTQLHTIIYSMFFLSWFIMKVSLPALPYLARVFQTTESTLKLSISVFFISLALSQLAWGAVSEKIGRKKAVLLGFLLCAVGTLVVVTSSNVIQYIIGRGLEGCGVGAISPCGRAILADVYETKKITKVWSVVGAICWTIPVIAPVVGGYVLLSLGWRYIFILYLLLLIIFMVFFQKNFAETSYHQSGHLNVLKIFKRYFNFIIDLKFWKYAFCYCFVCAILLGYYNAMPFWYVNGFHVAENLYAWLGIPSVGTYLIGLMMSRYCIHYYHIDTLIVAGLILIALSAFCAILFALLNITGIIPLVIVMSLFSLAGGIISPAANAGVLSSYSGSRSMVAALASSIIFLGTAGLSYIESHLYIKTLTQLAALLSVSSLLFIVLFLLLSRKTPKLS